MSNSRFGLRLAAGLVCSGAAMLGLSGCGGISTTTGRSAAEAGLAGSVHGGQQPVVGAVVQLIAPGTSGYGSAGTVIASTVTLGDGSFTLPRPYVCPANSNLVYLLATGGDSGAGANTAIAEAAILPKPCSSLAATDFYNITEVTTVAAAYVLAPFATVTTGVTAIGTSATNLKGLTNAGLAAANLADVTTGQAHGATDFPGFVVPTAELVTLADILSACVNQNSSTQSTAGCSALFAATPGTTGTAPTDTFQAAINIALNPGANVGTLFGLVPAAAPYQTPLSAAPTDFAMGFLFNDASISQSYAGPTGIDIDANGNAWIAIYALSGGVLDEISPGGVYLTPSGGYAIPGSAFPLAVGINSAGNIEVADFDNNAVYEVTPSLGTNGAFAVSTASSFNAPMDLAIDNRDSGTWVTDAGSDSVTHINVSGTEVAGSPYALSDSSSEALATAVDGSGNIWAVYSDQNFVQGNGGSDDGVVKLTPGSGGTYTATKFPVGAGVYPYDLAIDHAGDVWFTGLYGVTELSNTGAPISPAGGYIVPAPNTDIMTPDSIEIDGLGRAIVSEDVLTVPNAPGSIAIFGSDGTYLSETTAGYGYTANGIIPQSSNYPHTVAIDGSGNVWVTGQARNGYGGEQVAEIIGIAAPVLTPLSAQNSPNMLGTRP